jgi:hypothetical protein
MTSLVLGPVVFKDYEIPESVKGLAGKHTLAVHKLVGGQRVIDALGPDDDDRGWHGRLQGADATDRAQLLDALRVSGGQLPMSVGAFFAIVVISHLNLIFERSYQILYEIEVMVVDSGVNAGVAQSPVLDALVGGDISSAQTAAASFLSNAESLASDLSSLGD